MIYLLLVSYSVLFSLIYLVKSDDNSCDLYCSVSRTLAKDGFHRRLDYFIELPYINNWEKCTLYIEETIPSNFYVDTNELSDLVRFNKIAILVNQTVDVELPQILSNSFLLQLYTDLIEFNGKLISKSSFPIHIRYHLSQKEGGFVEASLNSPVILLHCPKLACPDFNRVLPCYYKSSDKCLFKTLEATEESRVTVQVPVGNLDDYFLVFSLTHFVTWSGTIYLLYVLISCSK